MTSIFRVSDLFGTSPYSSSWPYVYTMTTVADGAASRSQQTMKLYINSLPRGGATYRVYKTNANNLEYFGNAEALSLKSNKITIDGVSFNRSVKIQFSSGDILFNGLSVNGNVIYGDTIYDTIKETNSFVRGSLYPRSWPYVYVLTTSADGATSQLRQTLTINIFSLPNEGANYRVYKTNANNLEHFGNAKPLSLGSNEISIGGTNFNRAVKIQFSSGDIEFTDLSVNRSIESRTGGGGGSGGSIISLNYNKSTTNSLGFSFYF